MIPVRNSVFLNQSTQGLIKPNIFNMVTIDENGYLIAVDETIACALLDANIAKDDEPGDGGYPRTIKILTNHASLLIVTINSVKDDLLEHK